MVKSVIEVVALLVSVKKAVVEFSGLAFTSILTPPPGREEVMVTRNGKLGPGAGASTVFTAGEVVATIAGCPEQASAGFFLQVANIPAVIITLNTSIKAFLVFIVYVLDVRIKNKKNRRKHQSNDSDRTLPLALLLKTFSFSILHF